ncbi:uncharacterized protein SCODWIG_01955 [Saccharomycodes ludwigii]|uniref:DNA damage checkpoint protein 1 n=1 Tax=Saccharomycodes ludwigii TaxID=36035 RepID=A0A376B6T7_9ASCO|nr:hypothetical protein SCDLUD_001087 [Saccharomycodes ludwigii]KAH3903447.1 hypothetical protein SCDLUD_001087 [Saccharomycodes ludwigii]SSD60194.1 uncharacterized protein SCODWIG_01955 [Saccharomycodes ludwigii]
MSFKAVLTNVDHQNIFCKTINALTTINKELAVSVFNDKLILSASNITYTTICTAEFVSGFFDVFEFNINDIVIGSEGISNGVFNFKLSSLGVLFKNMVNKKPTRGSTNSNISKATVTTTGTANSVESGNENEIIFKIDNTITCPERLSNRFVIVIKQSNLITKQYLPNFTPTKYEQLLLEKKYKLDFYRLYGSDQAIDATLKSIFGSILEKYNKSPELTDLIDGHKDEEELHINFIRCDLSIWKNFTDSCNTHQIEEMKIEIDRENLKFVAFTRGIYGKNNSEILKSGMSLTNMVTTTDLDNTCLYTETQSITFKLKDFKTFLNISNSWGKRRNDGITGNALNVWFVSPGDPLMFEVSYDKLLKLNLYLVTDVNQNVSGNNSITGDGINEEKKTIILAKKPSQTIVAEDTCTNNKYNKASSNKHPKNMLFVTNDEDEELNHINTAITDLHERSNLPLSLNVDGEQKTLLARNNINFDSEESTDDSEDEEEKFNPRWENPLHGRKKTSANSTYLANNHMSTESLNTRYDITMPDEYSNKKINIDPGSIRNKTEVQWNTITEMEHNKKIRYTRAEEYEDSSTFSLVSNGKNTTTLNHINTITTNINDDKNAMNCGNDYDEGGKKPPNSLHCENAEQKRDDEDRLQNIDFSVGLGPTQPANKRLRGLFD